jgi:hypothetical protein
MAKTNFSEVSTAAITIEAQPGQDAGSSSLGAISATTATLTGALTGTSATFSGTVTPETLALGAGNAVTAAASAASTHKVAVSINGTTYYLLVSNV